MYISKYDVRSTTGHESAACVSLQERLGRPLLWLACRHHVGEVVLTHVWDALRIEVSKAPDVTVFVRYCGTSITQVTAGAYLYRKLS